MQKPFNLLLQVDNVPQTVTAAPVMYNDEVQYRVTVNGSDEVMFVFDPEIGRYAARGDDSETLADTVEAAIGDRLNSDSIKNH